jgi:hypothetical protein
MAAAGILNLLTLIAGVIVNPLGRKLVESLRRPREVRMLIAAWCAVTFLAAFLSTLAVLRCWRPLLNSL